MFGYLLINIVGILVFIGVAYLCSKKKKQIDWKSILIMLGLNVLLAWFLISFPVGRAMVQGAANGFNWLVQTAYDGIGFAFGSWVKTEPMDVFRRRPITDFISCPTF